MYPLFPTSPARFDTLDVSWTDQPIFYLVLATILLLVALRFMKRALMPIGAIVQAVAAAAIVAFTVGLALVLVAAAMLSGI